MAHNDNSPPRFEFQEFAGTRDLLLDEVRRQNVTIRSRQAFGVDLRQRSHRRRAQVREQEAADVPQLRDEVAARRKRLLQIVWVERDVHPEAHAGDDRVAERVGAEPRNHIQRVDAVA